MIAFDIISGEYRDCSDSLEYIDRQRSALSEKRIIINRTWHYCRRTAFASQQSASQGFIDDSHLDLFLRNAYIKRDYRDGLPDKAEWGQGLSPPSHPALPRAGRLWRGRYCPVRGAP
jgi:hypothetical protein